MKLIILGNGFDLASGLPTKYRDFFEDLTIKNNSNFKEINNFINKEINSSSKQSCINYFESTKNEIFVTSGKTPKQLAAEKFQISIDDDKRKVEELYNDFLINHIIDKLDFWAFLFWVKNKKMTENKDWFEVELEIKEFLNAILKISKNEEIDPEYSIFNSDFFRILMIENLSYFEDSKFENILDKVDNNSKLDALLLKYFLYLKDIYNNNIFYGLYLELTKFEDKFKNYIYEILEKFVRKDSNNLKIYRDNFLELIKHDSIHNQYSVLNFNYTSFTDSSNKISEAQKIIFRRENKDVNIFESNIHGNYRKLSIFGIDQKKIEATSPLYQFTKTYRKMIDQDKISRFSLPNINMIDEIIFYGHSLSDADYSYFQSIFDFYNIYQSDIKLSFFYSEYGLIEDFAELRRKQINNVSNLLNKYGDTIGNNDRGENLVHKLLLENRLGFKIIKLKKVHTSQLYFDLMDYRVNKAEVENVSSDKIFRYDIVTSIVEQKPTELKDLMKIKGFSDRKIENYGLDIIEIVKKQKYNKSI